MIGIGFENPGVRDLYSDGSPCVGEPISMDSLPQTKEFESMLSTTSTNRNPNPPAGDVHKREQNGLWRREAANRIAYEEAKAEVELQEKRVWGLAKQTCKGLANTLQIKYDIPAMANSIRSGFEMRKRQNLLNDAAPSSDQSQASSLNPDEQKDLKILEAVLNYDLPKVAHILQVKTRSNASMETTDLRTTILKYV